MPKSSRQAKLERKATKRKKQKQQQRGVPVVGRKAELLKAATWPLLECWVNENWHDTHHLNQVIVSRRNPNTDEIITAAFLVDRACLGVKRALIHRFPTIRAYRTDFLADIQSYQKMGEVELDFAAAIIKAGLDYAAGLEFYPPREYAETALLLGDADPTTVTVTIPVGGDDGKPFFVAGPQDNARKVTAQLERLLGPNGYHFIVPFLPETDDSLLDEESDWEEVPNEDEAENENT